MLGFAILFHLPKAARQRDREGRPAAGGAQVTAAAPGAARGSAEPCPRPQPPPHNGAGPALRHFVGASSPGWAAAAAGTAVRPLPAPPAAHLRRARPAALPPPARPPAAAAPQASPGGSPRRHPGPSLPPAAAKGDVPRPPSRHFVFPSSSMDGRRASRPEALSSPCPGRPAATSPLWGRGPARTPPSGPAPPPPPGRAPTSPAFSPPPPPAAHPCTAGPRRWPSSGRGATASAACARAAPPPRPAAPAPAPPPARPRRDTAAPTCWTSARARAPGSPPLLPPSCPPSSGRLCDLSASSQAWLRRTAALPLFLPPPSPARPYLTPMPPGSAGPSLRSKHTKRRRRPERNKSPAEPPGNAQPLNPAPQRRWTPLPRHRRFERRRCAALVLTHVNPALRHRGAGPSGRRLVSSPTRAQTLPAARRRRAALPRCLGAASPLPLAWGTAPRRPRPPPPLAAPRLLAPGPRAGGGLEAKMRLRD